MPLHWRGPQVEKDIESKLGDALGEIGLLIEGEAKQQLYPGHGVRTGTLRRSIHAASPSHNFASDSGAELGGQEVQAEKVGDRLMVAVGSGLVYAMAIHQGWSGGAGLRGSFAGYHYLTIAAERVSPKALSIVKKHLA